MVWIVNQREAEFELRLLPFYFLCSTVVAIFQIFREWADDILLASYPFSMNNTALQTKVRHFLESNPLATLSTIDAHSLKPESALIAFAETDDLEIIFETFSFSRKYANLQINNNVALVIGWDTKKHVTVQYEGKAHPVPHGELAYYEKIFLNKKTPCTEQYLHHPQAILYKVQPLWIRYSDYSVCPADIFELSFAQASSNTLAFVGCP